MLSTLYHICSWYYPDFWWRNYQQLVLSNLIPCVYLALLNKNHPHNTPDLGWTIDRNHNMTSIHSIPEDCSHIHNLNTHFLCYTMHKMFPDQNHSCLWYILQIVVCSYLQQIKLEKYLVCYFGNIKKNLRFWAWSLFKLEITWHIPQAGFCSTLQK